MGSLMQGWKISLGVVSAIAWLSAGNAAAQQPNIEAAKKEGRVVVYGAQVPQAMKPLHAAFEKKFGNSPGLTMSVLYRMLMGRTRQGVIMPSFSLN